MNAIEVNNIKHPLPSDWEEVDKKQALKLCSLSATPEHRVEMLLTIAGKGLKKKLGKLDDEQLHEAVFFLTKWVIEKPLLKQFMPVVRLGGKKLIGMADGIADIKFIEFIKAEACLKDFPQSSDMLCGLIFRTASEKEFDDFLWQKKTKLMEKVPERIKNTAIRFYIDSRNKVIDKFPKVFKKGGGGNKKATWTDVFTSMLEKPSDVDELANQPLFNVLTYLSQKAEKK